MWNQNERKHKTLTEKLSAIFLRGEKKPKERSYHLIQKDFTGFHLNFTSQIVHCVILVNLQMF